MRIVAGKFGGMRLAAPKSNNIRPTSDRVRESLFNILRHGLDQPFEGMRVLDLFAGTGALGLEALSRGADLAVFVDTETEARALIRQNVDHTSSGGVSKIFRRDATRLGPIGTMPPFDLCFLDPPYGKGLGEKALASARDGGWLKDRAVCILEEDAKAEIELPSGFHLGDTRQIGDTAILILEHQAAAA